MDFLDSFPDAKLLYMLRDPLSVIPSGLSLVTGVLDKRFGFWSLSEDRRQKYIDNLYKGLVELQIRFYNDWTSGKINRNNVMIVNFDKMMNIWIYFSTFEKNGQARRACKSFTGEERN